MTIETVRQTWVDAQGIMSIPLFHVAVDFQPLT